MCNLAEWLASGAALISAGMAYFAYFQAEKSKRAAYAATYAVHFINVRELIEYLKNTRGIVGQDRIEDRKRSIIYLKTCFPKEKALIGIFDDLIASIEKGDKGRIFTKDSLPGVSIEDYDQIIKRIIGE